MASITTRKGKKGTSYLAQIRMHGYPHASATFKRKSYATDWVKLTEADIMKGRYFKHQESAKHTISELIDKYLQWPKFKAKADKINQKRQLEWWRGEIGDKLICDVDSVLIGDIRDELSAEDEKGKVRAPATVNRYLAILSHVFTYAVKERKWAEANPCKDVARETEDNHIQRFLSDEERDSLLSACSEINPTLHLLVVLALSTGARRGELLNLRWPQVDLNQGQATLLKTKNKDIRTLPITGYALELLKEYRKVPRLDTDLVFPDPRDSSMPWNFRALWEKAIKQTEIKDFRFHDCRHTFASYCLKSGATLPELMHLMGHKSPAMVARYAHLCDNHASSIVERMNADMFGG